MTIVVHPGDSLTRRQRLVYVIVLGALTALGPFTIDLYLPAFPALEDDLGVTAGLVQLTLTATTDRLRRRPAARRPVERQGRPPRCP